MSFNPAQPSPSQYHEPYRPQYHYSLPQGWMNDPNGLVYYKGEYHLFFQHHPHDIFWGPMHWGHAVSRDLVHWETLPIALYPDEIGTIFSGTVVVDAQNTSGLVPGGGLVALYSYDKQSQGLASSLDSGRTWHKYPHNPVLPAMSKDFRDPKVFWYEPKQHWVMSIAAGQSIMFLTSANLIQRQVASSFDGGYQGGVWEVPDLIPLSLDGETKWVLIRSVNATGPAGGSATCYYVGDFDGMTFKADTPEHPIWLDYGPDNYAGTTWNNAPTAQPIYIAWMNNWDYANRIPTSSWRGAMTLPRELSLRQTSEGIRLVQKPIQMLSALRQPLGVWANLTIQDERELIGLRGQQIEIIAQLHVGTAETCGFEIFIGGYDTTRIVFHVQRQTLVVSRPQSRIPAFNPIFKTPFHSMDGRIQLHLFIDSSSLEIFGNDGLVSVTSQVFPSQFNDEIRVFATGGMARLIELQAFKIRSIWA